MTDSAPIRPNWPLATGHGPLATMLRSALRWDELRVGETRFLIFEEAE